jgi:hypothetical protein
MNNGYADVDHFLGPTLSGMGFELDEVQPDLSYKERPAWAVFYRRDDCKLQICWSAREGSTDFMLAKPTVPNGFGLENSGRGWHFLLMLSDFEDGLATPRLDADDETWWRWRKTLLLAHLPVALESMRQQT